MKPTSLDAIHTLSSGIEDEIKMSLSEKDFAHIASVLTNLYSDKILACVREYSTNAWDSHVDAGNTSTPIEVTLPRHDKPVFRVKDYGVGLNVDDIRDVYALYGRSTKRDSDEVNGVLGLGCKAALCYALSFTVTGVKDGVKTIALLTKDENGVGTIEILDTSATEEPNGVTIDIPVAGHQVQAFTVAASEFFQHWAKGTVLVDGNQPMTWREKNPDFLWLDSEIAVSPTNRQRGWTLVMGNVAYRDATANGKLDLVAYVPMGSVHFTPSREALQMSAMTQETISLLREYVEDSLARELIRQMEAAKTFFEKAKIYWVWRHHMPQEARSAFIGFFSTRGRNDDLTSLSVPDSLAADNFAIWNYNPTGYSSNGRQASSGLYLSWDSIANDTLPLVVNFPFKQVNPAHRERIQRMGWSRCVFIPEGCNLQILDGRPNVFTWNDVVTKTGGQIKMLGERKTRYTYYLDGRKYQGSDFPTDEPLLYIYAKDSRDQSVIRGIRLVSLGYRQEERFCKLFPHAQSYHTYRKELLGIWQASLTEEDKIWASFDKARYNTLSPFWSLIEGSRRLPWEKVEDPVLVELARKLRAGPPSTYSVPQGAVVPSVDNPYIKYLERNYGFLRAMSYNSDSLSLEDTLLFINAKYNSLSPQARLLRPNAAPALTPNAAPAVPTKTLLTVP